MKKKGVWAGVIGIAALSMVLPQWAGASSDSGDTPTIVMEEHDGEMNRFGHHHFKKHFIKEEFQALLDDGYTKREIFKGLHISHLAEKPIEDVLNIYKETSSWTETAEHFGVDEEKVRKHKHKHKWKKWQAELDAHKGEILEYLSAYTGKEVQELNGYLVDEIGLRHLIGAAVISKVSGTDLTEVLNYKKEGHTREEFAEHFNLDKEEFKAEMKKVHSDIKERIN
ncbi:hypothetical protein [Pseudalkalibacillus sp. SCS-8]|uniref:hypothetical protein n=1 Tax=Pseudalkalibacillus nanhaiensis TaxID=3115291 RepID=UPI0032DB97B4